MGLAALVGARACPTPPQRWIRHGRIRSPGPLVIIVRGQKNKLSICTLKKLDQSNLSISMVVNLIS
jgi:hypothetical protein